MKSLWDWLFKRKIRKEKIVTKEIRITDPLTPLKIYVNLLLIKIAKTNPTTYILKRSEALPSLTLASETIEIPSIEDVVDRLKELCDLKPCDDQQTVDSTINLTIQENAYLYNKYNVYMHFDNKSDECCQIRIVRTNIKPLKYKKKDLEYIKDNFK